MFLSDVAAFKTETKDGRLVSKELHNICTEKTSIFALGQFALLDKMPSFGIGTLQRSQLDGKEASQSR